MKMQINNQTVIVDSSPQRYYLQSTVPILEQPLNLSAWGVGCKDEHDGMKPTLTKNQEG